MKKYDIGIIGAGASGIMAAITAARNGCEVVLIEKNVKIGRKILATGNGRCNITNKNIKTENYHGADSIFIENILKQFDQNSTIDFFENLGLVLKEEDNGRMFPRTNQSTSVVEILEYELKRLGVEVYTTSTVTGIEKNNLWKIHLENKPDLEVKKLIITTGGKAAPQLGSTGDGIYFAKKMGHETVSQFPALVPVETIETWPKDIQGLKINALVEIIIEEKVVSKKDGDLLFTHYGVSGPAVMAQSRLIAQHIGKEKIMIKIDAFPEGTLNDLDEKIRKIFDTNGARSVKNVLAGLAPINLIIVILKNAKIDGTKKAAQISKDDRKNIAKNIKEIILTVKGLRPFKEAQVTSGGVAAKSLNANLESKITPGLFFAGEVIDVDGDSGGFNLQWAWSSGYVVGRNAANKI